MARWCRSGHHRRMTLALLVVDDSELIRSRLLGLLDGIAGLGPVHTAATLAQTLECVRSVQPHLMLLDLQLPDGNALRILPALQVLAPGMRIAVLTNYASAFSRSQCLQAGAHWFFDKSTEFPEAVELVRRQAARFAGAPSHAPLPQHSLSH